MKQKFVVNLLSDEVFWNGTIDHVKEYFNEFPNNLYFRGYHITTLTEKSVEDIRSGSGLLTLENSIKNSCLGEFIKSHEIEISFEDCYVRFNGVTICDKDSLQSSCISEKHLYLRLFGQDKELNFFSFIPENPINMNYSCINRYPEVLYDI
ncbi:hypothetical protein [Lacticaseibacillus suihuaensis]